MSHYLSRSRLLLVVCMLGLLAGCAMQPRGADRSLLEPGAADDLGYRLNWTRNLGLPPSQQLASVTVLDDVIVVIERPGNMVTALSVDDGRELWQVVLDRSSQQLFRPMRDGDNLYLASGSRLYTLNVRTGAERGLVNLRHYVSADPVLLNDKVFFAAATGRIFTWDLQRGAPARDYALSTRITAPLTMAGAGVFATDVHGQYALIDPVAVRPVWPVGRTFDAITAAPALDRLSIFIASEDGSLYAIDRYSGRDRWPAYRTTARLTQPPKVFGQQVFLPVPGEGLVAINATDGEEQWRLPVQVTPAAMRGEGRLIAFDETGIYLIDAVRGETLRRIESRQPLQEVVPVADGSLVVVSRHGQLIRLMPGR